jgi:small nuclear ribonucleoprotein D3
MSLKNSMGVPIKLLHEARGHVVTIELQNGTTYRGKLLDAEDNMNIQLTEITVTKRDGSMQQLEQVFVRGSHVRFIIVPDMLKNAPMFKNIGPGGVSRGPGLGVQGRGRGGKFLFV